MGPDETLSMPAPCEDTTINEPVIRRKRVTRRRHRRNVQKNCLSPPNSDEDVSVFFFWDPNSSEEHL
ncbi:unnamed protein product [Caenorhabditis angaria]|uniref:Uncharacterized protein n=1 Tax=Caenorhabditis angaria TaxID=860376 RepID=A0A9P1J444_9PELO|nr:unnamed protein product [Caenorhabditis angaria]